MRQGWARTASRPGSCSPRLCTARSRSYAWSRSSAGSRTQACPHLNIRVTVGAELGYDFFRGAVSLDFKKIENMSLIFFQFLIYFSSNSLYEAKYRIVNDKNMFFDIVCVSRLLFVVSLPGSFFMKDGEKKILTFYGIVCDF
jgi:hypothetical protein